MTEEWRPVDGWEKYEISDHGRLRRANDHSFIYSQRKNNKGRVHYCLQNKGVKWNMQAHTLVMEAFIGPRPEGMEARHIDGNHLNNHISNLVWGTHTENMRDKIRHGTNVTGRPRLFTKEQIREIRASYQHGVRGHGYMALASKYGVSMMTIIQIIRRKTYADV